MKVFKFTEGKYHYTYSGHTLEEARKMLEDEVGLGHYISEEIPESEWDEKIIKFNEDNDMEKEGFYLSIREVMEKDPMMICTNDYSLF